MIPMASGVRVWIATGHTDMRRGMNSLALTVQEALKRDPSERGATDGWRLREALTASRAEAIRRLVELGLKAKK
jgi:hypothetical protein